MDKFSTTALVLLAFGTSAIAAQVLQLTPRPESHACEQAGDLIRDIATRTRMGEELQRAGETAIASGKYPSISLTHLNDIEFFLRTYGDRLEPIALKEQYERLCRE